MSSSSWQDRRFMFPAGKQVHQGSSTYTPLEKEDPPVTIPSSTVESGSPPTSSSPGKVIPSWDGDRRFMFPSGKQIHEPARRASESGGSSGGKVTAATPKAASPPQSTQTSIASAIAGRRRVRRSPSHPTRCASSWID